MYTNTGQPVNDHCAPPHLWSVCYQCDNLHCVDRFWIKHAHTHTRRFSSDLQCHWFYLDTLGWYKVTLKYLDNIEIFEFWHPLKCTKCLLQKFSLSFFLMPNFEETVQTQPFIFYIWYNCEWRGNKINNTGKRKLLEVIHSVYIFMQTRAMRKSSSIRMWIW